MSAWRAAAALLAGVMIAGSAAAQPPAAIADQIKQLGRTVDPAATSRIYLPLHKADLPADVLVTRDVAYGAAPLNKLDVFRPAKAASKPLPVLVFIRGGGFVTGDKVMTFEGRPSPFYDNIMVWAVHNGMVGVNINYSLAPTAKYPTVQAELGQVLAWVRANAASIGGDPTKVVMWGNSAGAGHLAAYLSDPERFGTGGVKLAGAILSSGAYDLRDLTTRPEGSPHPYFGEPAAWAEHNSLDGLLKTPTPLLITVNEWDPEPTIAQGVKLNTALCAAARCPVFDTVEGHGHVSATYAINTEDDTMAAPVLQFLKRVR